MEKGDCSQVAQQQEQEEESRRSELCICCEKARNLPDNIVTGSTIWMTQVTTNFSKNKVSTECDCYLHAQQARLP